MIPEDFHIEPACWEVDQRDLRAVREQVFVIEQQVPVEDEWDMLDEKSHHVIARDGLGQPIGTGRLVPPRIRPASEDKPATSASIGRMAVLAGWRGNGVGAAILRVLLEHARAAGYVAIDLHAQSHAIPFYARFGFEVDGEEFEECGIAHRMMRRSLEPMPGRAPMPLPAKPEARALPVDDQAQALAAVTTLLADARHEVAIYTRDLDAALFDVPETLDALKRIALSGGHARIRIIVHDPRKPLAEGHQLIAMAQRLPSAFALRTPVDDNDLQYASAFLINDRRGYLFRVLGSRLEGEGSTYAPGRHAQLREFFDQVWERSAPSEELRLLAF